MFMGLKKFCFLCNLRILFAAVPRFFSSSVTLFFFSFPSIDSCKVNLTIFLTFSLHFFILKFCQVVETDEFEVNCLCLFVV
jgi:hypothetical protein